MTDKYFEVKVSPRGFTRKYCSNCHWQHSEMCACHIYGSLRNNHHGTIRAKQCKYDEYKFKKDKEDK